MSRNGSLKISVCEHQFEERDRKVLDLFGPGKKMVVICKHDKRTTIRLATVPHREQNRQARDNAPTDAPAKHPSNG